MAFFLKAKSEDYILRRISEDVGKLIELVKSLYEQQCLKADVNKSIVHGIKESGSKFELEGPKARLLSLVSSQKELVKQVLFSTNRVESSLNLLVHMEQISLALHREDDLSDMIDVKTMPLDRFKTELEHVKIMKSSFDILRVELEKQSQYVKDFDVDEGDPDEKYYEASERYESKLAEEEVISISQLKDFCTDLKHMVHQRLHSPVMDGSEPEKAAARVIEEFKRIHVGIFCSLHKLVRKLIKQSVRAGHQRELVSFLVFFLLSRLKKYNAGAYYGQVRAALLSYHIAHGPSNQRNAVAGAALLAKLRELDFPLDKLLDDEKEITKTYYLTVNQIFSEEFTFVNGIIAEFHGGSESSVVPWMNSGAKTLSLVFDFDGEIERCGFDPAKVRLERDSIRQKLEKGHPGQFHEIGALLSGWEGMIALPLRPQSINSSAAKIEPKHNIEVKE
jgi:hypothetical protein